MNNKDYNLDNYTNDELFEIFELDKRKDSMTNLKTLDTFMSFNIGWVICCFILHINSCKSNIRLYFFLKGK